MRKEDFIVNGLVLAAGFGTRLRPLTNNVPKPLLPVAGIPILDKILEKLSESGIRQIALNTHYHSDKIRQHVENGPFSHNVVVFHESDILGTGGPFVNAKTLLGDGSHILLHNGDILSDLDISSLLRFHFDQTHKTDSPVIATMTLIDGPENKVAVDGMVLVDILGKLGKETAVNKKLTYTGISIFSTKIFDFLPSHPINCSIIDGILKAMRQYPGCVKAFIPDNLRWNDIGSIKQFHQANMDELSTMDQKRGVNSSNLCSSKADIAESALVKHCVINDGARIAENTRLENCVVLSNAVVKPGSYHREEIIGADFCVHRDISFIKSMKIVEDLDWDNVEISSLPEHGSDRGFYRLKGLSSSQILMTSTKDDPDFHRFVELGRLFQTLALPTPAIYAYDDNEHTVLMEDLGTYTLNQWAIGKNTSDIEPLYKRVIERLVDFQFRATKGADEPAQESAPIRFFDYDYLRWETNYFKENHLERHLGIPKTETESLDGVFDALAKENLSHPQLVMHRDFQTQNIMIHSADIRFVDFQGARIGSIGYDIMSLINDPYLPLPFDVRSRLLSYWHQCWHSREKEAREAFADRFSALSIGFPWSEFQRIAICAGLQRVMQALGAFTFLSQVKGKSAYSAYINPGVERLVELLDAFDELNIETFSLNALKKIIS